MACDQIRVRHFRGIPRSRNRQGQGQHQQQAQKDIHGMFHSGFLLSRNLMPLYQTGPPVSKLDTPFFPVVK